MKKYLGVGLILLVCLFTFVFIKLTGKSNSNLTKIKLAEVTHSPFYAPLYAANRLGYFKDENLDVDITLVSGANNVTAAVLSGDVDVGFCGPEATIYIYNGGEKDYLVTFAGMTKRDGQFIVARKKNDNFTWDMLINKEVLAGRIAGMPELNFENALKNVGIKKSKVNINTAVDYASLSSAFISGTGDYVNLFEPNATKLEKMGYGYIVASIGTASGEMPYTAFNAKKSYIENHKDELTKFTKAIKKGLDYVLNNDATTIANVIVEDFPDTSKSDLITIVERYKTADTWLKTPYITETMFKNLEDIIIEAGQLEKYAPYDKLIQNIYED